MLGDIERNPQRAVVRENEEFATHWFAGLLHPCNLLPGAAPRLGRKTGLLGYLTWGAR